MTMRKCVASIPVVGKTLAGWLEKKPVVPVLHLGGVIGQAGGLRRNGLTLKDLEDCLDEAFSDQAKAVALVINSPGGSPVQSDLIAGRIRTLAIEKGIPVYAFCEDAAASGGYWLACAADEIYARPASIVGSIGVISAGFGFPKLLEKMGVERRVYTSGISKSQLDPFESEKEEDVIQIKALQGIIHQNFIDYVKARRGSRLNGEDEDLFNGAFWTGVQAEKLGLIDGLDDMRTFLRAKYGTKVKTPTITRKQGWFGKYLGGASLLKEDWIETSLDKLEDKTMARSLWGRLGL